MKFGINITRDIITPTGVWIPPLPTRRGEGGMVSLDVV